METRPYLLKDVTSTWRFSMHFRINSTSSCSFPWFVFHQDYVEKLWWCTSCIIKQQTKSGKITCRSSISNAAADYRCLLRTAASSWVIKKMAPSKSESCRLQHFGSYGIIFWLLLVYMWRSSTLESWAVPGEGW